MSGSWTGQKQRVKVTASMSGVGGWQRGRNKAR